MELTSGDGEDYSIYALVPGPLDHDKINEQLTVWLGKAQEAGNEAQKNSDDPEAGDVTYQDIQTEVEKMGCIMLTAGKSYGPQWD